MGILVFLVLLAGGLEMPPLVPGALVPGALLAEEGPEPGNRSLLYAFVVTPYGVPGLWYLGLGGRQGPWSLALRQYGNALYRHLRLSLGARRGRMLLGLGLESLRIGSYPLEGLWLEAGLPLFHSPPVYLETVVWNHLLRGGYRWTGLRVVGALATRPSLRFSLEMEPGESPVLAWQMTQRWHRLLGVQVAYRSVPRLLALTLQVFTRPALVYSLIYHPDLGLSHGWSLLWRGPVAGGSG